MRSEALVNTKGVASILIRLYDLNSSVPLTQLLDLIPTYARLLEVIDMLESENILIVSHGAKSNQRKISLTSMGREYTEHILDAESLRDLDLINKNKKL